MLTEYLVAVALVAVPDVNLTAAFSTQASGGYTPVQPGTPSGQAFSVEVTPDLSLRLSDARYDMAISYTPRIFYRGFLGDTEITPLNRPLFMHTAGFIYDHRLSEGWRLQMTANFEAGEVDFQSTAAGDPSAPLPTGPTPGGQTAAAQALTSLTLRGGINLTGQISRKVSWGNDVTVSYTAPLGDIQTAEEGEGEVTVIGQLPESLDFTYSTSFSYAFNREHSVNVGAGYGFNMFEALTEAATEGAPMLSEADRSQFFHSVNLTLGYGWNFARNSNLAISAGAQLAIGQADITDEMGQTSSNNDLIPLPTAQIGLTWLPINQRSLTVSNNLTVGVAGSVDPVFGTFQPRLTSALAFSLGFPPDLTIGVNGSFSTPLAPPETGQGVTFATGFGAGDSQLDLSIPVTYQFTRNVAGSIGVQMSHFFTRFGVRAVEMPMEGEDVFDPLGSSTTYEVFVALSFSLSTRAPGRGGTRTTGGSSS